MIVIDAAAVGANLDMATCIGLMREAMIALSAGRTKQLLRGIIDLDHSNAFGVMPGATEDAFGAKLVSVYPGNANVGGHSHQGLIALFDRDTGAPSCVIDASTVTAIRTAAASAAATDALAFAGARRLAILGTSEQAWRHAIAIPHVRDIDHISIWGRTLARAEACAVRVQEKTGIRAVAASSAALAAQDADIICTVSAASEPILFSGDVRDGAHVNVVGSSRAGPTEIDTALVARAHYFVDHRESVIKQGAEFLRAREAGAIDEAHILAEIGEVFAGEQPGRLSPRDVTIYKSLGSVVQDLACATYLHRIAEERGFGTRVNFAA